MQRARVAAWLAVALGGALLAPAASAWGPDGHRAAATVAASRLCPAAADAVARLLRDESLPDAAIWADGIRTTPDWRHTREWHYVNVGDTEPIGALLDPSPPRGLLLPAIAAELDVLADGRRGPGRRRTALRFVLHLVADLHQPLHVGRSEDRGGNEIDVRLGDETLPLHRVWDTALVRIAGLRWNEYARTLEPLALLEAAHWRRGTLLEWAEESRRLRPWVYGFDARRRLPLLSARYVAAGRQIAALRLAQAGVRTAWLLDRIWCGTTPAGEP